MSDINDDWEDDDRTRIQPSKKAPQKSAADADLMGTKDDATAFKKPLPAQARPQSRESAKTERAQPSHQKRLAQAQKQQRLGSNDPTQAASSLAAPEKDPLHSRGTLKNRFVLGRILGSGGMGVVYKAKDLLKVEAKDRDPFVAIKVLGEEFKSHPEAFIALQRESRKTQKIAHPNIVTVYDFDKDGDTVFMTMEFLDGYPLDKLIKKYKGSSIPRAQAWVVLQGICAALAYAHKQSIIHADLKPGNIFVTQNDVAKVFDFGIARAVANAEQGDAEADNEDKTIFDAGNLGALTPAYASLEMLEGEAPDIRDDVYALGCIAYELFTGKHPYQRKNAQDARRKGLKPEKIKSISKQQWKAIERALSFEREDRVSSSHEFWSLLSLEQTVPYKTWLAIGVITLFSIYFTYDSFFKAAPPVQPIISVEDVANEAERKVRAEIAENTLSGLLESAIFDERWEDALHRALLQFSQYVGEDDKRVFAATTHASQLYRQTIEKEIEAKQYTMAIKHINNSLRYSQDDTAATEFKHIIAEAIEADKQARLAQQKEDVIKSQQLKAQQDKNNAQAKKNQVAQKANARIQKAYNIALDNVTEQLNCKSSINMGNFTLAVHNLQKVDRQLYKKSEPKIISGLASCIKHIARNYPARAKKARQAALTLFNNHKKIASISIKSKDPCREGLAGQGSRGKRSICRDGLASGGRGPRLVIIPAKGSTSVFAIGRYEVTSTEMNTFCAATGCRTRKGALPATNISLKQAKDYLSWLSNETGKSYRLPTAKEWVLAAKAKGNPLNSNRNCKLNSRGIQKGGALVNAVVGQQNGWGLVNHLGNAHEWVTGSANKVFVAGGSFNTQMHLCTPEQVTSSDGKANKETGFRVVRQLTKH